MQLNQQAVKSFCQLIHVPAIETSHIQMIDQLSDPNTNKKIHVSEAQHKDSLKILVVSGSRKEETFKER